MAIALFMIVLNWTIYQYLPVMRRDAFFAVRVESSFRNSREAGKLLQQYRFLNLGLALTTAAALRGAGWASVGVVIAALAQNAAMFAILWQWRLRVLPFANRDQERDVSFAADPDGEGNVIPGWACLLALLPPLIMLGAGARLWMQWPEIPERFAVHWGPDGVADRFANKTFRSVYGTLIIGASSLIMAYAPILAAIAGTRRGGGELGVLRRFLYSMIGVNCGVAVLLAAIALQPLASSPEKLPLPFPVLLSFPIALIALAVIPMWRSGNREGLSDPTPEERWYAGRYYYNPDDAALMVRNRLGVGYSPNFGHRAVQIALPILLGQFGLTMYWVFG
jgi:uncharacterized membrane protein